MPGETRTWLVGKRRCTFTVPQSRSGQVATVTIEWHPDMPRQLSRKEWKQYRAGRDAAFAGLCGDLGIRGMLCAI